MQPLLLRALGSGEIQPVGSAETRRVDVRVNAATDADLADEIDAGRFPTPLLHRLAGWEIRFPDLAERVGRLLEKEPARRPADARQVVAELDRLLAAVSEPGRKAAGLDAVTAPPASSLTSLSTAAPGTSTGALQPKAAAAGDRLQDTTPVAEPATLATPPGAEAAMQVQETGDTYSARRLTGRSLLLALAGVSIADGSWGLLLLLRPPAEVEPGGGAAALEAALLAGYPMEEMRTDPELLELRQDVRFQRFALRLQRPSAG